MHKTGVEPFHPREQSYTHSEFFFTYASVILGRREYMIKNRIELPMLVLVSICNNRFQYKVFS